ncbi:MAG: hypothetical protein IPK62_04330 [Bacteroidetes bacterium]|nr:hypothetical protein [Bacteroidota bacterium]
MKKALLFIFLLFQIVFVNAQCWKFAACGHFSSHAIKKDGTLSGWGNNGSGQLGDGTNIDRNAPIQIGVDTNWESVTSGDSHLMQ